MFNKIKDFFCLSKHKRLRNEVLTGLIEEVDELKKELQLYKLDKLTQLPIRRDFEDTYEKMFESGKPFYLILADVNGLHVTNENGGYEAGDDLILKAVNELMKCNPMGAKNIYRYGGDEFVILFEFSRNYHSKDLHCPSEIFSIASKYSTDFENKEDLFRATNMLLKTRKAEHYKKTGADRRCH